MVCSDVVGGASDAFFDSLGARVFGPFETNILIVAPGKVGLPAGGFCDVTSPCGWFESTHSNVISTSDSSASSLTCSRFCPVKSGNEEALDIRLEMIRVKKIVTTIEEEKSMMSGLDEETPR